MRHLPWRETWCCAAGAHLPAGVQGGRARVPGPVPPGRQRILEAQAARQLRPDQQPRGSHSCSCQTPQWGPPGKLNRAPSRLRGAGLASCSGCAPCWEDAVTVGDLLTSRAWWCSLLGHGAVLRPLCLDGSRRESSLASRQCPVSSARAISPCAWLHEGAAMPTGQGTGRAVCLQGTESHAPLVVGSGRTSGASFGQYRYSGSGSGPGDRPGSGPTAPEHAGGSDIPLVPMSRSSGGQPSGWHKRSGQS